VFKDLNKSDPFIVNRSYCFILSIDMIASNVILFATAGNALRSTKIILTLLRITLYFQ
jgi:hypothetical protein